MKRTKIRNILLSALLALTVGMPTLSFADEGASAESGASGAGTTPYAAGDKDTVADPNTASTWRDWGLDYSTQSVGRIWTDKTVSTEGVALTGAGGTITIEKSSEADFLTAFSALSSTSNLKSKIAQPLDIVLVLDASGSMDNPMGNGDNTKRIDALKAAANSFIDEIAKQNANISDPAQQHQVSLVKFAGKISNQVGNNTYREGGYTYNYSQVMKDLTSCVGSLADDLKSTVNAIKPAGATQADYGLEFADGQTSGRENAKKIVVFFTDGSPTSSSGFEEKVARDAVSAAKSMKDAGATVYSVGIFSGANPVADPANSGTSDENKFMHAVSSNYPTASYSWQSGQWPWESGRWVWNFGARATNSDFYKAASNAADLKTLFDEISQEITSSTGLPTEVQQGYDPSTSGYITFTDQLGDYMKVDSFTTIVFAKQLFQNPVKTTSGNVDTYTFSGEAGNVLYPSGNLSSIVITVTKSDDLATGDFVEVKIPASLIPLRHFQIDESAGTGNVDMTFPIRVFFESSVKEDVESALANPDAALAAYIEANAAGDGVAFYANKWSGGEDGDVLAAFTPAKSNSYYYMTEETPIYTDEACTVPAKGALNADGTYYYKRSWYDIGNGQATPRSGAIQFSGNISESLFGYIGTDASGNAVFKPGTPRITYIDELRTSKDSNPTATAATVLNPLWSGNNITCHLGNNGKLVIEKPGTLAISKSLVVPEGYNGADFANDTFPFTIEIDKAEGQEFPAEVRDVYNKPVGNAFTIAFDDNGEATHSLKDGETLYIRGLSAGWNYTVSEQLTTGFDQIAPAENNDPQAATGTIAAGTQATAEFANAYRPSGTLDGNKSLNVRKVLKGRDWTANDTFRFVLSPTDNAPMPLGENGEPNGVLTLTKQDLVDGGYAAGTFGNITYTKPGTYVYEISEDQSVGAGAGMSLSQARYRVDVTVTEKLAGQGDDATHQGILNVSSVMVRITDDNGASVQSGDRVDAATFTNEFAAREAKWIPAVMKEYTDNSGTNPLAHGMFNFCIEPVTAHAPMPVNPIGEVNADGSVTFEDITFTSDMIKESFQYQYRITEVVQDGAGKWVNVANADESLLQTGMTYDKSSWIVTVAITSETIDNEQVVVCTAGYQLADAAQGSSAESFATFRNSYTPTPVSVPANDFAAGTKTLTGRDMLPDETFGFVLFPADDATQSAVGNHVVQLTNNTDAVARGGTNGRAVDFSFGGATFTKPGTYTFEVHENSWNSQEIPVDGTQGMTFDRHTATIVVTVTDNNGVLAAARTVKNSLNFTNRYTAAGDYVGLVLSKTLNGRSMDQGEFSFQIVGADAATKGLLGGDGTRTFVNSEPRAAGVAYEATLLTDLHFTQDHVGKTFTFNVSENVPPDEAPGMTYDKKTHRVAISVDSDNAGALAITTTVDGAIGNKVSFTNTYEADPAVFDTQTGFGLYKVLEGRGWEADDAFSFLLEPLTMGAPRPDNPIVTVDAGMVGSATGHAPISFGGITFEQVGVYKYRVTEKNAGQIIGGVKYSSNAAEFTVTVTDLDEDGVHTGKLVATAQLTTTPNTREFTNVAGFEYDDNQIPVIAFKRFTNNSAVEMPDMTGLFTFELTAAEANAPMPVATTAHNDADGSVDFGVITFDASLFDNGPIVINSAPAAKSAASESNAAGKAVASDVPAADDAAAPEAGAAAPDLGDADKGEGSAPADAGAAPAADAAAVPAAKPAGDGPTTDNPPADANTLVFHYTITEKAGGHADVTNDPNPTFTFEVTVTRDNAGNVTANVTNVQDYVKGTPLRTFTNTYTYTPPVIPDPDPIFAAPVAKKILEGRALVAGEFSFELLENGKVVSTGTNDADGNVVFSDIKFTEAGTHIYTMREIGAGTTAAGVTYDATTYQVTADVVEIDNELRVDFAIDGADGAVFKNAYKAKGTTVIIGATKTLEGRTLAAGEFTFKLTGADGRTYEAKNAADGRIEFPAIDFDKVGTYDFTLVEMNDGQTGITYDGRSYKVTVVVTDDGKGNLVANVTWPNGTPPTFKNTYTKPVPAVTPGTPGKPPVRFAKTGDETMPIACVATLAILAAGAVGAAAFGALRKREKGDERQ